MGLSGRAAVSVSPSGRPRSTSICVGLCVGLLCFGLACAEENQAEPASDTGTWLQRTTLTGGWGGARKALADRGIQVSANYIIDSLGNISGGRQRSFAYAGLLTLQFDLDLEKLLGVDGARFVVSGTWASGDNLSDQMGSVIQVANVFNGRSVRLSRLYWEQALFGQSLDIKLGRVAAEDDFATSSLYQNFVSYAINGNPVSLNQDDGNISQDPVESWGLTLRAVPEDSFYLLYGLYNSSPSGEALGLESAHGVDFGLRPDRGLLAMAEVGYRSNQEEASQGLPGNYKLGAFYDTAEFDTLAPADERSRGNYGLYVLMDQMIYREAQTKDRGLSWLLAFTATPKSSVSSISYFAFGGLVYSGLIPSRERDTTSIGVAHARFSSDLDATYEMVLELTHNFQVTPWLSLQPDFQYIFRPGGSGKIHDAVVLGWQTAVTF